MKIDFLNIFLVILLSGISLICLAQSDSSAVNETNKSLRWDPQASFWWEFYNESTVLQKFDDNFISFSHTKPGIRISGLLGRTAEFYFLLRYGKDQHRDFWNNRAETGIGLRIKLFKKVFVAPYIELIQGYYMNIPDKYPQPQEEKYEDVRGGLLFWYGWDNYFPYTSLFSFPKKFWGEIYSEMSYYKNQRKNVIGYWHIKSGFHVVQFWKSCVDVYGVSYLMKDINKDFWNNKAEIGPAIRIKPVSGLDLQFFMEYLFGTYYGIEGRDPNPYPQQYTDRRVGLIFWIGW
ncbi:MAG: hypothetical protein R6V04_01490 [bacterium]